ncbi:MAG: DUF3014 domain-containing protein [Gammaproteobacteria bacterium]|nr:DUF3014 domain-containing protein [Gammaproteobacteria bacterium]
MNRPLFPIIATILILGAGVAYYLLEKRSEPPAPVASAPVPTLAPAPASAPAIQHPVPAAAPGGSPTASSLPALDASDAPLRAALAGIVGADVLKRFLAPEDLIRRIVVTVDNLPRRKLPYDRLPVTTPAGGFIASGEGAHATLDPRNYARYTPMVDVLRAIDMRLLARVYLHFYPLFQSAYQDLGYPDGYFNDRLIAVIDQLLATPQPAEPIELVQPHVQYHFADPALEDLSAGQKVLIRMGPDNAAVVKSQLSALRAALTAAPIATRH